MCIGTNGYTKHHVQPSDYCEAGIEFSVVGKECLLTPLGTGERETAAQIVDRAMVQHGAIRPFRQSSAGSVRFHIDKRKHWLGCDD